jgi:hypothetical protein
MKNAVFWDVTPREKRADVSEERIVSILMMEAIRSSKRRFLQKPRRDSPEDDILRGDVRFLRTVG